MFHLQAVLLPAQPAQLGLHCGAVRVGSGHLHHSAGEGDVLLQGQLGAVDHEGGVAVRRGLGAEGAGVVWGKTGACSASAAAMTAWIISMSSTLNAPTA